MAACVGLQQGLVGVGRQEDDARRWEDLHPREHDRNRWGLGGQRAEGGDHRGVRDLIPDRQRDVRARARVGHEGESISREGLAHPPDGEVRMERPLLAGKALSAPLGDELVESLAIINV